MTVFKTFFQLLLVMTGCALASFSVLGGIGVVANDLSILLYLTVLGGVFLSFGVLALFYFNIK